MSVVKNIVAMIACGLSAITIFPRTDYGKSIPRSAQDVTAMAHQISSDAWRMTGRSIQHSIDKIGKGVVTHNG